MAVFKGRSGAGEAYRRHGEAQRAAWQNIGQGVAAPLANLYPQLAEAKQAETRELRAVESHDAALKASEASTKTAAYNLEQAQLEEKRSKDWWRIYSGNTRTTENGTSYVDWDALRETPEFIENPGFMQGQIFEIQKITADAQRSTNGALAEAFTKLRGAWAGVTDAASLSQNIPTIEQLLEEIAALTGTDPRDAGIGVEYDDSGDPIYDPEYAKTQQQIGYDAAQRAQAQVLAWTEALQSEDYAEASVAGRRMLLEGQQGRMGGVIGGFESQEDIDTFVKLHGQQFHPTTLSPDGETEIPGFRDWMTMTGLDTFEDQKSYDAKVRRHVPEWDEWEGNAVRSAVRGEYSPSETDLLDEETVGKLLAACRYADDSETCVAGVMKGVEIQNEGVKAAKALFTKLGVPIVEDPISDTIWNQATNTLSQTLNSITRAMQNGPSEEDLEGATPLLRVMLRAGEPITAEVAANWWHDSNNIVRAKLHTFSIEAEAKLVEKVRAKLENYRTEPGRWETQQGSEELYERFKAGRIPLREVAQGVEPVKRGRLYTALGKAKAAGDTWEEAKARLEGIDTLAEGRRIPKDSSIPEIYRWLSDEDFVTELKRENPVYETFNFSPLVHLHRLYPTAIAQHKPVIEEGETQAAFGNRLAIWELQNAPVVFGTGVNREKLFEALVAEKPERPEREELSTVAYNKALEDYQTTLQAWTAKVATSDLLQQQIGLLLGPQ